jgi:putative Holliday junction resolvase
VRALGLDIGSKTIGKAVTDEVGIAAHPVGVWQRRGLSADVAHVLAEVDRLEAACVVVGMPFELSGREGVAARRVRLLLGALRHARPALVIHEQDERFSTAEAERVLIAGDVSRARRKAVIDQQAAAIILQSWLDAARPPS